MAESDLTADDLRRADEMLQECVMELARLCGGGFRWNDNMELRLTQSFRATPTSKIRFAVEASEGPVSPGACAQGARIIRLMIRDRTTKPISGWELDRIFGTHERMSRVRLVTHLMNLHHQLSGDVWEALSFTKDPARPHAAAKLGPDGVPAGAGRLG